VVRRCEKENNAYSAAISSLAACRIGVAEKFWATYARALVQSVQCPFLLVVDFFILYAITEMDIGLIGPKWSSRTYEMPCQSMQI